MTSRSNASTKAEESTEMFRESRPGTSMNSVGVLAGSVSTALFVGSALPMLYKAARTKDLGSYSLGNIVLANVGNAVYALYVFSLPAGPIWAMHTFYLVSTALMLFWYLRYELSKRREVAEELIKQTFRGYLPIGVQHDGIELRLRHVEQLHAQPAAMPDVRRTEEAIGLDLDHLHLDTVGRRAPDRQPAILVMIIEEHHEASFVCNEERRATVADPLRCLRPAQRRGSDHSQRTGDIGAPIVWHRSIQRNDDLSTGGKIMQRLPLRFQSGKRASITVMTPSTPTHPAVPRSPTGEG